MQVHWVQSRTAGLLSAAHIHTFCGLQRHGNSAKSVRTLILFKKILYTWFKRPIRNEQTRCLDPLIYSIFNFTEVCVLKFYASGSGRARCFGLLWYLNPVSLSLSLSLFGHSQHVGHHAAEERMEGGVRAEDRGEQQHGPGRGPEHALVSLLPPLPRGLRQQYVHVRWSTPRAMLTRAKITRPSAVYKGY